MKTKRRKWLGVLLAVVMVISFLPTSVFAAEEGPAAQVGDTTYDTLNEAVEAVVASDSKTGTVVLLRDASGSGIGLFNSKGATGVDLTIDFGGHTYTCMDPAVGSSGTESQGFHLEKGNIVTLRNGSIVVDSNSTATQMLIQNYCNLTLTDLNLTGSNITSYIISSNYGDVVMNNVNIAGTASGLVGIDVMHWLGTTYEDKAPTMVINNTAANSVQGSIDVYCYGAGAAECTEKPSLTINSGSFAVNPAAYLAEGAVAAESNGMYTVHYPVKTEATEATCTQDGNIAYWHCEDCGEYFEDAACTQPISLEGTVIAATGHKYENGICTVCGETIQTEVPAVDPEQPVEEVTLGVDQDNTVQLNEEAGNIVDEIISGSSTAVSDETAALVAEAIADGKTISTVVEFANIEATTADSEKASELLDENEEVAQFFDLSIALIADGEYVGAIQKLSKPMTFQLVVPNELIKADREYFVIRIHNGVAEKLPATFDGTNMITFQSDKFSTYALGYTDLAENTGNDNTQEENTNNSNESEVPTTGDGSSLSLWFSILAFSCVGILGMVIYQNKKRTNR